MPQPASAIPSIPIVLPNDADESKVLTRAEFTKILINALFPGKASEKCFGRLVYKENPDYRLLFADMNIAHPMAKEVCMAMRAGLVRGYDDGTFRPDSPINFAEASKLLSRVFAFSPYPNNNPKVTWYLPYVEALADRNVIPQTIMSFTSQLTVADMREILERIRLSVTWRPSLSALELQKKTEKWLKARR